MDLHIFADGNFVDGQISVTHTTIIRNFHFCGSNRSHKISSAFEYFCNSSFMRFEAIHKKKLLMQPRLGPTSSSSQEGLSVTMVVRPDSRVKLKKCRFGGQELPYLDHIIGDGKLRAACMTLNQQQPN